METITKANVALKLSEYFCIGITSTCVCLFVQLNSILSVTCATLLFDVNENSIRVLKSNAYFNDL